MFVNDFNFNKTTIKNDNVGGSGRLGTGQKSDKLVAIGDRP